jgi:predicted  nucleic acid-binding Zn-ribbon protein
MTIKSLWQQLKDLVDCDKKIATITKEIADVEQGIKQDQQREGQQDLLIAEKEQLIFNLQKSLNLQELSTKELKDKEDLKRKQLDNVKDQKQYKALENEIAALSKERLDLEEQVIKQWFTMDMYKTEVEVLKTNKGKQTEIIKHDLDIKAENIAHLKEKLAQAQQERTVAMSQVLPEWQTQYERMRHSVPDPIVPVINSSCSACFYAILPQDLTKLKKSNIMICRNCYRFLYFDEEEAKDANKAQY